MISYGRASESCMGIDGIKRILTSLSPLLRSFLSLLLSSCEFIEPVSVIVFAFSPKYFRI
jgi:hypothetical protein